MPDQRADIVVIGSGAAGLFASIWAGRALREAGRSDARVVALDGARSLGAKILVAGGGRCNVTHHAVDESAYAGSSRNAIRKVLRRFDVPATVEFFRHAGVALKREETGKLFPTTDSARTVLNALLHAASLAGVEVVHPWRVASVERDADGEGFVIRRADAGTAPRSEPLAQTSGPNSAHTSETLHARRVIFCTGGKSLPKSGSDGSGYDLARNLGHTITQRVFPSLVPLLLTDKHPLTELSGLTLETTLEVRAASGKKLASFTNSTLLTHFGLSGPAVLDISRYYLDAAEAETGGAKLFISFIPARAAAQVDEDLRLLGRGTVGRYFAAHTPDRLMRLLCERAAVEPATVGAVLTREQRLALVESFCELELPIRGDRGWNYAEVTAGGVPLSEVHLDTMESRVCPGLHLAGEVCDVDGRIGGFNFQWAWASGYVAGTSAAKSLVGISQGVSREHLGGEFV
ncbi:MAG: NAD(P)/FAD-dependent oxidoreductase [Phycisphaerales bacterium]